VGKDPASGHTARKASLFRGRLPPHISKSARLPCSNIPFSNLLLAANLRRRALSHAVPDFADLTWAIAFLSARGRLDYVKKRI
jgi:hypothetical protein